MRIFNENWDGIVRNRKNSVSEAVGDGVLAENRYMSGVDEAYAHPNEKPIGAFTLAGATKFRNSAQGRFEYRISQDSWGKSHGLPHEVCVSSKDPTGKQNWRAANVKGTVCIIALDEDAEGKPVLEKWTIRNHVKYMKAEGVEMEESAPVPAQTVSHTHGYKVGDILCASWGYNMTIPQFFKVTRLVGSSKIEVVELDQNKVGDGWSGQATPGHNPTSTPKVFSVKKSGRPDPGIKIHSSAVATKWDGRPKYYNFLD